MKKYLVLLAKGSELIWEEILENKVKDTYEFLSGMVEGNIERALIPEFESKGIDIWCNEEGLFRCENPAFIICNNGELKNMIKGNVVFSRCNDDGETLPLNDEDKSYILNTFLNNEVIIKMDNTYKTCYMINE